MRFRKPAKLQAMTSCVGLLEYAVLQGRGVLRFLGRVNIFSWATWRRCKLVWGGRSRDSWWAASAKSSGRDLLGQEVGIPIQLDVSIHWNRSHHEIPRKIPPRIWRVLDFFVQSFRLEAKFWFNLRSNLERRRGLRYLSMSAGQQDTAGGSAGASRGRFRQRWVRSGYSFPQTAAVELWSRSCFRRQQYNLTHRYKRQLTLL